MNVRAFPAPNPTANHLRDWIETLASNHGFAIGALTGARDGRFTLKSGVRSPGVVAQLIIHYES